MPSGRDPVDYDRTRRRVLWSLPTGLYLVGSHAVLESGEQWNLMTANLVVQVAVEPKLLAVAVDRTARTRALVAASGSFSLSLLDRAARAVVRRFVKPVDDVTLGEDGRPVALNGEPIALATTGSPVLSAAPAWLDCEVRHQVDLGSHLLFIGEVVDVGGKGTGGEGRTVGEVLRMEDTRMSYGG
ncbi:MAG TPA: flavin reductase family protein [Acidimicrobiales bacterium]